jgi:hypothetical protein
VGVALAPQRAVVLALVGGVVNAWMFLVDDPDWRASMA